MTVYGAGRMDSSDLSSTQIAVIDRLSSGGASVNELRDVFGDPGEAFVCSPVGLSIRQLARMYEDSIPEDERHRFVSDLRRRCRNERWHEQRAVFQARRTAARKDALIEAEAQVWAILGLEFHQRRLRGLIERWEALNSYVMDGLERCERGDRAYGTDLRDAARELSSVEESIAEIMPTMGVPSRAQQFWSDKAGTREDIIARIEGKIRSVVGGDRASHVFEVIDGGGGDRDA